MIGSCAVGGRFQEVLARSRKYSTSRSTSRKSTACRIVSDRREPRKVSPVDTEALLDELQGDINRSASSATIFSVVLGASPRIMAQSTHPLL